MNKRLLILGATSGIGKLASDNALSRGYDVRAFGRSADTLDKKPQLEPWVGDALIAEDIARALDGVDAVIYALGIKESIAMLWQEVTLFSDTSRILIDQMQQKNIRRLVVVTGFGAGRSKAAMSRIERLGHRAILGRPYADKDRQEELIMASDLDWTIVRPVILTNNAKTGNFRVLRDEKQWRNGLISRADVATYLVDAAASDDDMRRDVVLAR
ncbi:NAD(P)-dependent oxidoreductase [Roseobacter sp. CCS2]|uniref:NAD(P)-dependent oxidoreductase n=1 Tax=Roseobacter sp. CCS2 TaxID=391593 RepID=UPI0000F3F760|nr:NAD(P)-binding oxidoreductase [Roseobacter sp. CCS2]EBA10593.1 NAD-dependent epimerase/dehydratase [Roseobacter sp. CCS2]